MSNKNEACAVKRTSIGGQALIEGVMMRGVAEYAIAVREKDGGIHVETHPNKAPKWVNKAPVIRGVVNMFQSLVLGYKCLSKSIDISGFADEDEDETVAAVPDSAEAPVSESKAEEEKKEEKKKEGGNGLLMAIAGVLGACLSLFLFLFLPTFVIDVASEFRDFGAWRVVLEAVAKITIFLLFLWLTGKQSDLKRVYSYHGAEHKSIACYEAGEALTPENAMKFRRFHPRCGTSFLFLAILVSILVFSVVRVDGLWLRTGLKFLLMPLVIGLTYEVIKFAGRHDNWFTRILSAPGLAIQRLTTKEPDPAMLEVAIASLTAVLPKDGENDNW